MFLMHFLLYMLIKRILYLKTHFIFYIFHRLVLYLLMISVQQRPNVLLEIILCRIQCNVLRISQRVCWEIKVSIFEKSRHHQNNNIVHIHASYLSFLYHLGIFECQCVENYTGDPLVECHHVDACPYPMPDTLPQSADVGKLRSPLKVNSKYFFLDTVVIDPDRPTTDIWIDVSSFVKTHIILLSSKVV